jgi:hypothetical protein
MQHFHIFISMITNTEGLHTAPPPDSATQMRLARKGDHLARTTPWRWTTRDHRFNPSMERLEKRSRHRHHPVAHLQLERMMSPPDHLIWTVIETSQRGGGTVPADENKLSLKELFR